ncbi:catechol 2,3-dioxygenase [Chloroflexus aggregans]|uniref:Metapyrocatechase n=1 Tax=Chloroflexus aggregans (strain MD-66 / DSM 9485) TaxID=326427 RepID=B8GBV2_CHLAD|nr:catechol 2,3-dioxygenase [Chloroflexus aggregans]ACL24919.1 catechol 2,3 dioxygenase [Chloroflexus aggregans DSM 9485]
MSEPIFDTHQLAHVEILTPKPDQTLWFFRDLLGMEVTKQEGQSVYMRAYEDWYHHTLKITEAKEPGLGHVAWRTSSPQALERRVKAIEASGFGKGWIDGDLGHGAAYQFTTPDGHPMEILWEVEYFQPTEDQKTPLLNRPQKRPLRGVPVRRLDHVNLLASDVTVNKTFMMEQLGFRLREHIVLNNEIEAGCWLSVSPLVHEVALMRDGKGARGRLHHVCYWYGYPQNLNDLADVFREQGIFIEAGPGKHGISQAMFMYVYEPGGNRVELFGDPGYLIFDPAWKPIVWTEESLAAGIVWFGGNLPGEFFLYGTPIVHEQEPVEATA